MSHKFKQLILLILATAILGFGVYLYAQNVGIGKLNGVKEPTISQLAKECFLAGGRLHEGEKFRDKDGKFEGFKSVKCVFSDKEEVFEKDGRKGVFKKR